VFRRFRSAHVPLPPEDAQRPEGVISQGARASCEVSRSRRATDQNASDGDSSAPGSRERHRSRPPGPGRGAPVGWHEIRWGCRFRRPAFVTTVSPPATRGPQD
jgi:hypothetical protein